MADGISPQLADELAAQANRYARLRGEKPYSPRSVRPLLRSSVISPVSSTDSVPNLLMSSIDALPIEQRRRRISLLGPNPDDPEGLQTVDPQTVAAAGLPPRLFYRLPDVADALRVKQAQTAPEPKATLRAQLLARSDAVKEWLKRFGALQVPQAEEITLPPPVTRKTEAIPTRQRQPNTFGRIAAAIAGLIAPDAAGAFGAAELGGEEAGADRNYQDALTRYKMATEQDTQAYEDAERMREEALRTNILNRDTRFGNQQARYDAETQRIVQQMLGEQAGGEAQRLEPIDAAARQAGVLGAQAGNIEERLRRADVLRGEQFKAELANARSQVDILKTLLLSGSRENIAGMQQKGLMERTEKQIKGRMTLQEARDTASWKRLQATLSERERVARLARGTQLQIARLRGAVDPRLKAAAAEVSAAGKALSSTSGIVQSNLDAKMMPTDEQMAKLDSALKNQRDAVKKYNDLATDIAKSGGVSASSGKGPHFKWENGKLVPLK